VELFGDDWNKPGEYAGGADEMTRSRVIEALRGVLDPEVGVNIVDLGVLDRVTVEGSVIRISLTPTSPSCPLGEQIRYEVAQRVLALKNITSVDVTDVWDPPWSPERMSAAARGLLGAR